MPDGPRIDTGLVLPPDLVDKANADYWPAVRAGWYVLAVRFRTAEWCAAAALLGRPEDDDRLAQLEADAAGLLAEGHRLVNHPEREDAEREVTMAFADLRVAIQEARERFGLAVTVPVVA